MRSLQVQLAEAKANVQRTDAAVDDQYEVMATLANPSHPGFDPSVQVSVSVQDVPFEHAWLEMSTRLADMYSSGIL
jgi:hypothetical protein